jgi:hypothetical protein
VPSFPNARYYGEIAPTLSNFATFRGQVRDATIGPTTVPDFAFADSRKVRELLRHGAIVAAVVVPAGLTSDVAPIVRVADSKRREILLLGQKGGDMVFGVRSRAASLRLRSPLFSLPETIPDRGAISGSTANDILRLSRRYGFGEVLVRVQRRSETNERHVLLTPSLGWTLVLPFQWYLRGTRTVGRGDFPARQHNTAKYRI